jgi:3-hydroxyacyl-[acyl-carrier-protein] dehydratase
MRFNLLDRIVEVRAGQALRAIKNLTLGEEYLGDHFPTFPVLPGVLMLQALVEAGSWLLRVTDDFRDSVTVLREVRNIKYGNFVLPGTQMLLAVELVERHGRLASLKGKGEVDGQSTVSARLVLEHYNLRDIDPALQPNDDRLVQHLRAQFVTLTKAPKGPPRNEGTQR